MTRDELKRLKELCEQATPGPWVLAPELCGPEGQGVYHKESLGLICEVGDPYPRGDNHPQENMELIVAARTYMMPLIEALEDLMDAADILVYRRDYVGKSVALIPVQSIERLEGALEQAQKAMGRDKHEIA